MDGRKRILLSYCSYPLPPAAYLERALRRQHEVVTFGPWVDGRIQRRLESDLQPAVPTDLGYVTPRPAEALARFAPGWKPDLFLWVETVFRFPIEGLEELDCPRACWFIDSHFYFPKELEWARSFDVVFVAQRAYVERFRAQGIDAHWLPVACDPEIHGERPVARLHPIGFVGSLGNQRRVDLLTRLEERFFVAISDCTLERMAEHYSRSQVVFNNAVNGDLNMRVFEAMAAGALLLTDPSPGSGLEELFRDGEHCAMYPDDERLVEVAARWLRDRDRRSTVARRGQSEVLGRHTYAHRARVIEDMMLCGRPSVRDRVRRPDLRVKPCHHHALTWIGPSRSRFSPTRATVHRAARSGGGRQVSAGSTEIGVQRPPSRHPGRSRIA